jgi:DNA-binding CsgD family transcriptional regulator
VLPLLGGDDERVGKPTSILRALVAAALSLGRRAEAVRWVDLVAARVEAGGGLPAGTVRVACARAELLLDAGDPPAAAEVASRAVELADEQTVRQDAARARIVLGRALHESGDPDGAVAVLERVIVDAGRGGAERLASEAARELRRTGARVSASMWRAATTGDEELTERERSIAELVAEGRSNKEVAATLFLSGKTVENNLSRIYAKLGVRSRTELARTLRTR